MNERIKELLVKAGMQFRLGNIPTHIDSNGTHTFNEFYIYDKFDPEKFGELIVQECADIADKNSPLSYPDHGIKIKRHFGVN